MFRSDFAEGVSTDHLSTDFGGGPTDISISGDAHSATDTAQNEDDSHSYAFEDSDDEEDEEDDPAHEIHLTLPSRLQHTQEDEDVGEDNRLLSWTTVAEGDAASLEPDDQQGRNVKQKVFHPSSPRSERADSLTESRDLPPAPKKADITKEVVPGPAKLRVVVKDVAYATYRAVLHYVGTIPLNNVITAIDAYMQIYTDTIVFAPLASTFQVHHAQIAGPSISSTLSLGKLRGHLSPNASSSTPAATAEGPLFPLSHNSKVHDALAGLYQPTSRKEWIAEWERRNPNRPRPCSAKAVYRLADSELHYHYGGSRQLTTPLYRIGLARLKGQGIPAYYQIPERG